MILTGEDRSAYRKTLSATNPTWAGLGLNPSFQGKTPPSNCLSHGAAWKEVMLADFLGGNKTKKKKKTVVSLRTKIWTRDIPIMNQAYQTLNHNIRYWYPLFWISQVFLSRLVPWLVSRWSVDPPCRCHTEQL